MSIIKDRIHMVFCDKCEAVLEEDNSTAFLTRDDAVNAAFEEKWWIKIHYFLWFIWKIKALCPKCKKTLVYDLKNGCMSNDCNHPNCNCSYHPHYEQKS